MTVTIYFSHGRLIVFDYRKRCWQEQCLDYLKFSIHSLSLLVSAGGLEKLIICNPITMRCKYLQVPSGFTVKAINDPLPDLRKPVVTLEAAKEAIKAFQRSFGKEVVVGLLTERHKQWYRLVVAGICDEENNERATVVYDSFTERWTKGAEVSKGARFSESGKTERGRFSLLHNLKALPGSPVVLDWPWSIIRYDSDNDKWAEIRLGRRGSILPQLVEHRGRIVELQRNGKTENKVSFWELNEDKPLVSMITRHLPCSLFPPKSGKRCPMILQDWCVGQGDWRYIAGRSRQKDAVTACPRGLVILSHNFTANICTRLPTMADATTLHHFSAALHGFHNATWLHAFEPSLGAKV